MPAELPLPVEGLAAAEMLDRTIPVVRMRGTAGRETRRVLDKKDAQALKEAQIEPHREEALLEDGVARTKFVLMFSYVFF